MIHALVEVERSIKNVVWNKKRFIRQGITNGLKLRKNGNKY